MSILLLLPHHQLKSLIKFYNATRQAPHEPYSIRATQQHIRMPASPLQHVPHEHYNQPHKDIHAPPAELLHLYLVQSGNLS